MNEKIKKIYHDMPLASKIRYSYFIILVPAVLFMVFSFILMANTNKKYDGMIKAATVASEFSLDFKKDFDYETYLLVVENKTIGESGLHNLLSEANRIVYDLENMNTSETNAQRLSSVKKYLKNLEIYKSRIEDNLLKGNMYEENIEIWENDVQIVTALVKETMLQYIYYEIQDMQAARELYRQSYLKVITISVVTVTLLLGVIILMSFYIPAGITRPISVLSKVTDQVAKGDLTVRAEVDGGAEVEVLSDSLNTMIDKINELLSQVTSEQIRLRNAELELLQAQINPHFLYNTLDTIVWLAEAGDEKKVVSMVGSLSDFFRTSLNQGKEIISVKEELLHVKSYLEIQQVRYQDILEYEIDVPEELDYCLIPKITLQPLVENALYHGIKNKRGKGKITITGAREESFFVLKVSDNGIGMTEERLKEIKDSLVNKNLETSGIYGLYNVNERIILKFGEDYGIDVESTYGEGTRICVKLPLEQKNQPES